MHRCSISWNRSPIAETAETRSSNSEEFVKGFGVGGGQDNEWGTKQRRCKGDAPSGSDRDGGGCSLPAPSWFVGGAPEYGATRSSSQHRVSKAGPNHPRQQTSGSPQPQNQPYRGPAGTQVQRPAQNPYAPQTGARGVYPNANYNIPAYGRQSYPGTAQQTYAPPGHLGAWLNTHRNVPVQQQQQVLRNDPSFRRLPPGEQQRLMNQLNRVNQMPDAQRQRTLARAENLERLSPEDRAQVAASARRWSNLPQDRQTMMRNAFRDLKAVPPDQRSIVLNSSRYQSPVQPGRARHPVKYAAG